MGSVSVDELTHGMVLSDDVLDINRRLLLTKGQTVASKHIRVFKIWGITEVNVFGKNRKEKKVEPEINPELFETFKVQTKRMFRNIDLDHPVANEIFRLSLLYRCHNKAVDALEPVKLSQFDNSLTKLKSNIGERINTIQIKLPELSSIVCELNEIVADPMASANDLAEVVYKSPSLAALMR